MEARGDGSEGRRRQGFFLLLAFLNGADFSVVFLFGHGGQGRCLSIRPVFVLYFISLFWCCRGSLLFWLVLPVSSWLIVVSFVFIN